MTQAYRHIRKGAVAVARPTTDVAGLQTLILTVLLVLLASAGWMQLT